MPGDSRFLQALQNAAHAPAFAVLAFLIVELFRATALANASAARRYAVTFLACLLIGIAIEIIQGCLGRDSSATDVLTDMLGCAAGLSLYAFFDPRLTVARSSARIGLLGIGVISASLAAAPLAKAVTAYAHRLANFPVLAEFNSSLGLYFLDATQNATAAVLPAPWARAPQEKALYVSLGAQQWPGVSIEEPSPDWSDYRTLCVDLVNPISADLPLNIRVHDRAHKQRMNDRFNLEFTVAARTRQILRIPLFKIQRSPQGRPMDMRRIDGIIIFGETPHPEAASFYLVRIWLE